MSNNDDGLEQPLRLAWARARASWPSLPLAFEPFGAHVRRLLPADDDAGPRAALLDALAASDLYLACACLQGMSAAHHLLETHFLARLPSQLGHLKLSKPVLDEVCQSVRILLLVDTPETPPRLAEYMGVGSLSSWLRVIAVRMAHKQSPPARETPEDDMLEAMAELPSPGPSPEFDLIRRRYHHDFLQALNEAFSTLPPEQHYLLRLRFVNGLSTIELGALYRKNQSTLSRWLKRARKKVRDETKRLLCERLGLNSKDFESLLLMLGSQLDLSVSQILREEDDSSSSEPEEE
ncbi:sigma-70 family RNA polymerase sigma factor [Melittangium boletus]|uniref:sigma-70 family RNA polymerase sigma factor n=1 Tax=Melittangium boletus TaxID=83453 RepID=UPI001FE9750E|nr:sigma-70 family RNA polymerase sigma factor [Melittangium boletus]